MVTERRIALLVEYDGAGFAGSQAQEEQRTVQGALEEAILHFTGECRRVALAGRTDAGVHAVEQVVALDTGTTHDAATFRRALNHFLPEDVVVRAAVEVAADFDPRRHAQSRVYRYEIDDSGERSALRRHRAWQVRHPLDDDAMSSAAQTLPTDARDWAAFAGTVPEGYPTVRTLRSCEVQRCSPHGLTVTVEADGFLRQQVRRIVGALERVGAGRLDAGEFAQLVNGPPGSAGPTAPPQGLTLLAVRYPRGTVMWETVEQ